jgi:hypothetical protein
MLLIIKILSGAEVQYNGESSDTILSIKHSLKRKKVYKSPWSSWFSKVSSLTMNKPLRIDKGAVEDGGLAVTKEV